VTKEMTGKERMLTAFRHGVPDKVPVEPGLDIDGLARLSGRPFCEVYLNDMMMELETEAARTYGYDIWAYYGKIEKKGPRSRGWRQ